MSVKELPVPEPWCSFCGTKKTQVDVLIASTHEIGKYICSNCIIKLKLELKNETDKLPS